MPTPPINYSDLPEHLQAGVQAYIEDHCPTGGFLHAVLSNDLKDACARADDINQYLLWDIVAWFYNNAPMTCWGSPERVEAWLVPGKVPASRD